jgi:hypothetical protein
MTEPNSPPKAPPRPGQQRARLQAGVFQPARARRLRHRDRFLFLTCAISTGYASTVSGAIASGWCIRVGLTQQQIADRLGVTRTTIQNWEGGATSIPQAVEMSCEI